MWGRRIMPIFAGAFPPLAGMRKEEGERLEWFNVNG